MRKLICLVLALPLTALAQNSLNGTWKIQPDATQLGDKGYVLLLQNGVFSCTTCKPSLHVKADGADQKVTGDPYSDTIAVKVIDDRNLEVVSKKNGKERRTEKDSLSEDGKTLNMAWTEDENGKPVTGTMTFQRVAPGPKGAKPISGTWKAAKITDMSDAGLLYTYKIDGNTVTYSTPTGQSYKAQIDGPDAPYVGDPGTTSISVKKLGPDSMQETGKLNGKVAFIAKMTVSGDKMTTNLDDVMHGRKVRFVAVKQ